MTEQTTKFPLLVIADAIKNCIKANNQEWLVKHTENAKQLLLDNLPHGSGIDCDWKIDIWDNVIECHNSIHVMNDAGYYTHWIDFCVNIKTTHRDIFGKLVFSIKGKFGKDQDIKDYLYESVMYSLENL